MKKLVLVAGIISASFIASAQTLSELYKKLNPSVVVIYTHGTKVVGGGSRLNKVSADGFGSGVLIDDKNWYIMTAAHVVQGAEKLRVVFPSGEDIPAKVISSAPNADVAMIKLDWPPLKTTVKAVKIGDSDAMEIGQEVFVIGAPMGLEHSLSRGVISGRHSMDKVSGKGKKLEFFQTDAAINTGNSGGPMFNMNGEVVGLVSSILTQSGGFEGIGFAVTSNIAKQLLLEQAHFWSGLEGVYVSASIASALNVPQEGGFLIQKVVPVSLGGRMGLIGGNYRAYIDGQEILIGGDVLLSVNDIPFTSEKNVESISEILGALTPGTSFKVSVLRAGKIIVLTGSMPVD